MTVLRARQWWLAVAAGLTLAWASGCQTYVPGTGQTLPSGYYLKHPPQYIPPTPPFPLSREEGNLELANQASLAGTPLPQQK